MDTYTTAMECSFIDGLGQFSKAKASRLELLENYLQTAHEREQWGAVDQQVVINHTIECIEREQQKP